MNFDVSMVCHGNADVDGEMELRVMRLVLGVTLGYHKPPIQGVTLGESHARIKCNTCCVTRRQSKALH